MADTESVRGLGDRCQDKAAGRFGRDDAQRIRGRRWGVLQGGIRVSARQGGRWANRERLRASGRAGAQPHMHFAFVPIVESAVMTNDKAHPLRWTARDEEEESRPQGWNGQKGIPRAP